MRFTQCFIYTYLCVHSFSADMQKYICTVETLCLSFSVVLHLKHVKTYLFLFNSYSAFYNTYCFKAALQKVHQKAFMLALLQYISV